MSETLSYETLYDALRREKSRQELQKLNSSFYKDSDDYIKGKVITLSSQKQKSSIFAQKEIEKTEKQLENIKKIIRELYEKREIKITQLALSSARTKNLEEINELLPEEKEIFDKLVETLRSSREILIETIIEGKPKVIKSESETRLIRFTQGVSKFVDDSLKEYGPFEEEYVALLPNKIAEILIKSSKAEPI